LCAKERIGATDWWRKARSAYRTILIVDIEKYGASYRDDPIRLWLHTDLRELLTAALGESGIERAQYTIDSTGDGWLVTIDPVVGKPRILVPVVDRLAAGLLERNGQTDAAGSLRVRLVLHAGDLLVVDDYVVGGQLVFAFRLLDADELRLLLERASGPLVVCVSNPVYQHVIAQRHEELDPSAYEPVWLHCKDVRGLGWIRAPDEPGLAARAGILARDTLTG
jgi:hypothetical protein